MQLPITAFSCMPSADAADPKTPSAERPSQPQNDHASSPPSLPLPTATPAHLKWKDACVATRQHSNYSDAFDYGKAQQMEIANGISTPSDWITTRPYGEWCKSNPAAIAIDCEMCATKDPVSGKVNPKALCRISVVNAEKPEEVLLDTLVKPEWPVVSYRTWVNGISESELKDVQFTMKHAQQFMAALCSDQTLVVGHAVHNDLLTLRMIHHCNVDTAMLFSHGGENSGTVSLKNLALAVMKRDMPEVHDSVNDARVALRCAEHYVANDGKVDPVKKVHNRNSSSGIETDGSDTSVLFVHRLPNGILQEHITEMFLAYTYIKPKKVNAIEFSGTHGKVHVEFFTKEHAELAYMSLEGVAKADKVGRKQKRVGLKGGGYVYIRKMRKGK